MEAWRKELYHHGIRGQKWGVRNGPPYPLSRSTHSRVVRQSGSALRGMKRSKYDRIRRKYANIGDSGSSLGTITDDARRVAEKYGYPLKRPPTTTVSQDIKATNPEWFDHPDEREWQNNCTHAVVAYACRRRGLDVTAAPMTKKQGSQGGASLYDTCNWYFKGGFDGNDDTRVNRDFRVISLSSPVDLFGGILTMNGRSFEQRASAGFGKVYKDAPDGAYGIANMTTTQGGHVFTWYKEDGVVKFADSQAGVNARPDFTNVARYGYPRALVCVRLDDRELNEDRIGECITSAKSAVKHSIFDEALNELYHHGIKGQKWGVRNGPPYPLSAEAHSAAEKKANRRSSLDRPAGRAYSENRKSGLSDRQKRVLLASVKLGVAAAMAYGLYKSGALDEVRNYGERAARRAMTRIGPHPVQDVPHIVKDVPHVAQKAVATKIDPATGFKQKADTGPRTLQAITDDVRAINPSNSRTNCVACAVTSDLRARGYDVVAKFKPDGKAFSFAEVSLLYDGFKLKKLETPPVDIEDAYRQLDKTFLSFGNGARGILTGIYNETTQRELRSRKGNIDERVRFGHAMSWEVLNGKVIYSEGQTGQVLSNLLRSSFWNFDKDQKIEYERLDNLQIDPEFAKIFAKSRQGK